MPYFFNSIPKNSAFDPKTKFEGNRHLLTEDHWYGLNQICNTVSSRFNSNYIISITQIEENGNLKSIRLHCKNDPGWLMRAVSPIRLSTEQINNQDGTYFMDLNAKDVKNTKYTHLFIKFRQHNLCLNDDHLEALLDINYRVEELMFPCPSPITYEEILTNYDPESKVTSGPLKSVMLKLKLYPEGRRAKLKNPQDFEDTIIQPLKKQLCEHFSSLVRDYGIASNDCAFIEFNEEALAHWLDSREENIPRP